MKVLIAEDDLISRRLLEATLTKWGFRVLVASDGLAAWQALKGEDAPRMAILDWMMPGMDGIQICQSIRHEGEKLYRYIILLTSRDRKQDLIAGLEAGADDYLVKPVDAAELKARLGTGRRIIDLQDQLLAANDSLQYQATHDPLTGLWNHGTILEILNRELVRTQRENTPLGVIMADLDHFKRINDTYGHMAGDTVLHETAERLRSILRPYDSIGRYGGEEFLVVLPGCDANGVRSFGQRLCESLADMPIGVSTLRIPVTISVGACSTAADNPAIADWLLKTADAALYRAKNGGRNRVVYSSAEDNLEPKA